MRSIIKFDRQWDEARLLADLRTAEAIGQSHFHWSTKDHDGGWSAIPLVSLGGRTDADALKYGEGKYEKTPILQQCLYFNEIVDSFDCVKHRIRLMRLEPGTNILEHRDPGDSWALGQVRIHIPIVTHDEVYFFLDQKRVVMTPGEMWYLDFSRPHRVANRSPLARVHFVLDLEVGPSLLKMFPQESLLERLYNVQYRWRYRSSNTLRDFARRSPLNAFRKWLKAKKADAS